MAPEIDRLIAEMRALPFEDREAIIKSVSESPLAQTDSSARTEQAADEAYQKGLLAAGLISEVRLRRRDQQAFEFAPVDIQGEPLSQTIVEERR